MTTFADNLDGTAGDLLSARSGWSRTVGVDNATIVTGGSGIALTPNAGGSSTGTWHAPTSQPSGNDQYAEAYLGAVANAFPLGVRCDTSVATGGGYLARCNATNVLELSRRSTSGVLLSLGTYTVPTPSDLTTNKVRLEVSGTSLTVSFKGSVVIGPITRTDFASGSVAMLSRGGTPSTTVYTLDDWDAGDIGAAGINGTAAGSIDFTGSSAGAAQVQAASAGSLAITGASAGAVGVKATSSGSFALTGAATGVIVAAGTATASGLIDFTGTSAGTVAIQAAGAGSVDFTGTAAGTAASTGNNASGAIDFTGSAAGKLAVAGASSGSFGITGTAVTSIRITGLGAGSFAFAGASAATVGAAPTRLATASRPILSQGTSRPRQYSSPRPRAASSW